MNEHEHDQRELPVITEMPDRALLAEFLAGLSGAVTVIFDTLLGKFVRVRPSGDDE
jgi:hypothetical protein